MKRSHLLTWTRCGRVAGIVRKAYPDVIRIWN